MPWTDLQEIYLEAIAERLAEPVSNDCPKCGNPMQINSEGQRDCDFGHWGDAGVFSWL